ncbi:hypothetical protein MNBD_GAMMA25-2491 [hydrothermal vent metagenome]|uniref:Uncharacterized protein n=1 Tax=hydrothermal vent metagenome TaxID=652676 RepID=A0A3B1BBV1_9ZZZZ
MAFLKAMRFITTSKLLIFCRNKRTTPKRISHLIFITFISALLFACGGGGGGSTPVADDGAAAADENNTDGNPTTTATETLQIFIKTTTGRSTTSLPGGVSLESETEYVVRLLPDTLTTSIFDKNYSPSYATSSIMPYTVDDRLFIREDIRPYEPSGSHNYTEYGIDESGSAFDGSAAVLMQFTARDPNQLGDYCWAIVGDQYIYKNRRVREDPFTPYVGGDMRQIRGITNNFFGDGTATERRCTSSSKLYSANGKLHDVFTFTGPVRIDGVTRKTTNIDAESSLLSVDYFDSAWNFKTFLPAEDYDDESHLRYGFDKDNMYYVRYRTTDSAIEIWTVDNAPYAYDAEPIKIYDAATGFTPDYFDVDDGRIVIAGSGQGKVLLLDVINGTERIFDFGVDIYGVQVLYAEF